MKIILEDIESNEIEVTIKGNISDTRVQHLIAVLREGNITSKIMLYDDEKEILAKVDEILYFEVSDRRVFAIANENRYLCKYTLSELSKLFKSQGITQIGKSLLVNVHHVKSLEAEFSGNYVVSLDNGEKLVASRFYMKEFRNAIMEV